MEYSHRSAKPKPEGTCRSAVGSKSVNKHCVNLLRTRTYLLDRNSYFVLWDSPRSVFSVSQHPFPRTEKCVVPTVTQHLPLYRRSNWELAKNKHRDNKQADIKSIETTWRDIWLFHFIHLPMKMEPIVSSETLAIRTQTPGNYPKRNKLYFTFLYLRCFTYVPPACQYIYIYIYMYIYTVYIYIYI